MVELCLVSAGLGVGLAMDACAVSMSNGLNEPHMKAGKVCLIAATFAFFQALMPMIGWLCVRFILELFSKLTVAVPFVALALLVIIGGKMLYDGCANKEKQSNAGKLTAGALLLQAVATSIDALSTGFSLSDIAGDSWGGALLSVGIIAAITFVLCFASVHLGKKFGDKLGNKAQIVGGVILIAIGLEIFISGLLG